MSVIDAIVKANEEGRKVIWPSQLKYVRWEDIVDDIIDEKYLSYGDLYDHYNDDTDYKPGQ